MPKISLFVNNENIELNTNSDKKESSNQNSQMLTISNNKNKTIPERKISNASSNESQSSSSAASCSAESFSNNSNISAISSCSFICYCCNCHGNKNNKANHLSPNIFNKTSHHHHQCCQRQQRKLHLQSENGEEDETKLTSLQVPTIIVKDRNVYSTPSSPIPYQITKWIEHQQSRISSTSSLITKIEDKQKQHEEMMPCYNCKFSKSVPDFINNSKLKVNSSKDICGTVDRINSAKSCDCKLNTNSSNNSQRSKSESVIIKESPVESKFMSNNNSNSKNRCITPSDNIFFPKPQQDRLSPQSVLNDVSGKCCQTTSSFCSYCSFSEKPTKEETSTPSKVNNGCTCSCCCPSCCCDDHGSTNSAKSLPEFTYYLPHVDLNKQCLVVDNKPAKSNEITKKSNLKNYKINSNQNQIERELSSSSNSQVTSGCDFFNKYFDSTTTTATTTTNTSHSNASQYEQDLNELEANSNTNDRKSSSTEHNNLTTKVKSKFNKFVHNFHNTNRSSSLSASSSMSQQSCSNRQSVNNNSLLMIQNLVNLSFDGNTANNNCEANLESIARAASPTTSIRKQQVNQKKKILSRASFSKITKKTSKSTSELDNLTVLDNTTNKLKKLKRESSINKNNKKNKPQPSTQLDVVSKKKLFRTQKSKTINVLDDTSKSPKSKGNLTM